MGYKMYGIKKKNRFLPITAILASIVVIVGIIISVACLKVDTKINLDILSDGTHQTETRTLNGTTLTKEFLQDVVQEGKVFSSWYYDDNYTLKAKVGDRVNANTTLFARQQSETEGAYWARVDNQLNAGEIIMYGSPFSSGVGSGAEYNPYIITTPEDMGVFTRIMADTEYADYYLSACYKLEGDIRLDTVDVTWPSAGTKARPFSGTFDGDGHMVYYISGTKGLFNYINNATIKNLTIKGLNVSATEIVGGLASTVSGTSTIKNCQMWGDIKSNLEIVGGFIGEVADANSKTLIETSSSNVRINATSSSTQTAVSGFVAKANNVEIRGCMNFGLVESNGSNVGGLVGEATKLTMEHSINDSLVKGETKVGGLVGNVTDSATTIHNSFNRGNVNSTGAKVGGLVGELNGTLVNGYNVANIESSADSYVAGVVGYGSSNATVKSCYSLGGVVCTISVVSYNPIANGEATVTNCGYNNNATINGTAVDKINTPSTKYSNAKNLFDGTNATQQDQLASSLNTSNTYNNYSDSGMNWDESYLWKTNVMDFSKISPQILENGNFDETTYQVTFYVNGLKKLIVSYTLIQKVQEPEISGMTVTWYKDENFTELFLFNSSISSNISVYGKAEIDEGIEYTIALDPEVTGAKLTATSLTVKKGKDFTGTLVSTTTKKISRVEVAMENNENPTVSYNTETGELVISNVVGNVYITPIFAESLDTPIIGIVENELLIQPVKNATDYTVDLYKDGVKQSSYTPTIGYKSVSTYSKDSTIPYHMEIAGWGFNNNNELVTLSNIDYTPYVRFEIPFTGVLTGNYSYTGSDSLYINILDDEFPNDMREEIDCGESSGDFEVEVEAGLYFYAYVDKYTETDLGDKYLIGNLLLTSEDGDEYYLLDSSDSSWGVGIWESAEDTSFSDYAGNYIAIDDREAYLSRKMIFEIQQDGYIEFGWQLLVENSALLIAIYNPIPDPSASYYGGESIVDARSVTTSIATAKMYVSKGQIFYAGFYSESGDMTGEVGAIITPIKFYTFDFEDAGSNDLQLEEINLDWKAINETTFKSNNIIIPNSESVFKFEIPVSGILSYDLKEIIPTGSSSLSCSIQILNADGTVAKSVGYIRNRTSNEIQDYRRTVKVEQGQFFTCCYADGNGAGTKLESYVTISNIKISTSESFSDTLLSAFDVDSSVDNPFTTSDGLTYTSNNAGTKNKSNIKFVAKKSGVLKFTVNNTSGSNNLIDFSITNSDGSERYDEITQQLFSTSDTGWFISAHFNVGESITVTSRVSDSSSNIVRNFSITDISFSDESSAYQITTSNINMISIGKFFAQSSSSNCELVIDEMENHGSYSSYAFGKVKSEKSGLLKFDVLFAEMGGAPEVHVDLGIYVLDSSGNVIKSGFGTFDAKRMVGMFLRSSYDGSFGIEVEAGQYVLFTVSSVNYRTNSSGNLITINNFRYATQSAQKKLDLTDIRAGMVAGSEYKLVVTASDSSNKYASSQAELTLS